MGAKDANGKASGQVPLTPWEPGSYNVRMYDDQHNLLAMNDLIQVRETDTPGRPTQSPANTTGQQSASSGQDGSSQNIAQSAAANARNNILVPTVSLSASNTVSPVESGPLKNFSGNWQINFDN